MKSAILINDEALFRVDKSSEIIVPPEEIKTPCVVEIIEKYEIEPLPGLVNTHVLFKIEGCGALFETNYDWLFIANTEESIAKYLEYKEALDEYDLADLKLNGCRENLHRI